MSLSTVYDIDIRTCLTEHVGAMGLAAPEHDALVPAMNDALIRLRAMRDEGTLPLLSYPQRHDDLAAAKPAIERLSALSDVIVLGTGGSSLGGATLSRLVDPQAPGWDRPSVHFLDNIDPVTFERLMARLDPGQTGLVSISKSGGTAETLCQTAILVDWMKSAGGLSGVAGRSLFITEAKPSPLTRIADAMGAEVLPHDPNVGGRYSVLTTTGLVPAAIAGVDVAAVRRGAARQLAVSLDAVGVTDSPAGMGALLNVGLARHRSVNQTVLLPYVDRLDRLGKWFRQLWAESLGKDGNGTTPIDALGTVDQHSQLQLWRDGPADKLFTVILGPFAGTGRRVDGFVSEAAGADLDYLAGRTMGDLMDAEQRATVDSLVSAGRPTRVISLKSVEADVLGALMMQFMLETILAADLLGVTAFDQPAVEDGKIRARAYLSAMQKS